MLLTLSCVTYAYPTAANPILQDVSVAFPEGWTALLGDNGCGKTTLARIACGLIAPDSGSVTAGRFSVLCSQETADAPDALFEFAGAYDRTARELRAALRIEDDMSWRYGDLSCGEQKKIQIATALWQRPDVLVIDEPTNHLDADARAQLADVLGRFRGVGILVSHDRALIDAVADRCASFERGGIVVRPGGFTAARAQEERERTARMRERTAARKDLARLTAEKARRAHEAARADARSSKRGIDPKDRDAKARIDLARVSGQDGVRGRLSAQMDARIETVRTRLDAAIADKRYDGELSIDASPHARKVIARIPAADVPCGGGRLRLPDLFVGSADHIGIVGPNGAGKSTLIAHVRSFVPDDVPILDIPQEISPVQQACVLARVSALSSKERGQVLSTIAQLNSDPDRILEGGRTSPGELRKLMLALGLLDRPQLMVMDEPTNHLDLHSVEALERALAAYTGALLLVSHDRAFLSACTDRTWIVRNGAVQPR